MLQLTSSEVNVITVTNILKNTKIKRGTGDKIKTMTKLILPIVDTTSRDKETKIETKLISAKLSISSHVKLS